MQKRRRLPGARSEEPCQPLPTPVVWFLDKADPRGKYATPSLRKGVLPDGGTFRRDAAPSRDHSGSRR